MPSCKTCRQGVKHEANSKSRKISDFPEYQESWILKCVHCQLSHPPPKSWPPAWIYCCRPSHHCFTLPSCETWRNSVRLFQNFRAFDSWNWYESSHISVLPSLPPPLTVLSTSLSLSVISDVTALKPVLCECVCVCVCTGPSLLWDRSWHRLAWKA